jgi:hypothetical protein
MPSVEFTKILRAGREKLRVFLNPKGTRRGGSTNDSAPVATLERTVRRGKGFVRNLLMLVNSESGGIQPKDFVWIFGAGRTGSTWLAAMMEDIEGYAVWFEPRVGTVFDPNHLQADRHGGKDFIFSPHYKKVWLRSIRSFVMDAANARFPQTAGRDYLVIKEPEGSSGAPWLMEAMPEGRIVLLIRDPRDIAASWVDANKEGAWRSHRLGLSGEVSSDDPKEANKIVRRTARNYVDNIQAAKQALDAHQGPKAVVKYEDLRADTFGAMKRLYSDLELEVDEAELARVVEKHSWENIPEDKKGAGKFFRKAKPGGWKEDLTPRQVEIVEKVTAPVIKEFYGDS